MGEMPSISPVERVFAKTELMKEPAISSKAINAFPALKQTFVYYAPAQHGREIALVLP